MVLGLDPGLRTGVKVAVVEMSRKIAPAPEYGAGTEPVPLRTLSEVTPAPVTLSNVAEARRKR